MEVGKKGGEVNGHEKNAIGMVESKNSLGVRLASPEFVSWNRNRGENRLGRPKGPTT
ncbi:hypothetical protein JHK87_052739 [Glycine soja]|nr:hypothetical protein JHK87_052739 [Glycine soja]